MSGWMVVRYNGRVLSQHRWWLAAWLMAAMYGNCYIVRA